MEQNQIDERYHYATSPRRLKQDFKN